MIEDGPQEVFRFPSGQSSGSWPASTESRSLTMASQPPLRNPPIEQHLRECAPRLRVRTLSSVLAGVAGVVLLLCSSAVALPPNHAGSRPSRYQSTFIPVSSSLGLSRTITPSLALKPVSSPSSAIRLDMIPTPRRTRNRDVRCSVDVGLALYDIQIWAKQLVDTQLTHLTPVSGAVLYGAGLLTSLSPCALSLVPLTMAYLTDDGTDPARDQRTLLFRAATFTVGLATSLSVLGLSATLAGKLFGSAGAGALGAALPLTASAVAIVMGLNLLDLVSLRLPSFDAALQLERFPPSLQAFLLGATSALIASPCSTPVLASILGFVAASGEPYLGAGLLFSYSLGYSTPLLLAGLLSGTVTSFIAKRGDGFSWVTPATGALLISYGTYSSLATLFPQD